MIEDNLEMAGRRASLATGEMWACGRSGSLIKLSQILELHTPLVGLHMVTKVDFLSKMIGAKINL